MSPNLNARGLGLGETPLRRWGGYRGSFIVSVRHRHRRRNARVVSEDGTWESRRGLPESLFRVLMPYSNGGGWQLDPLAALRPGSPHHGQIGTILAFDVLEHIPHFERTVAAMVDALRPGGLLVEQSPFEDLGVDGNGTDTRLHISAGGVTMQAAMGPLMRMIGGSATKHRGKGTHLWRKQSTCIAGFSHMCKGWQRRCIGALPNSSYK